MEDGWIEWAGGKCPVSMSEIVNVRYRSGAENVVEARHRDWKHMPNMVPADDIIAYRVAQP